MSSPYSASGNNGISVADAKAYITSIYPDEIQAQITHYNTVAGSLNTLAASVKTINSKLQSTWSGSAADAANTQFTSMANQASNLASMLTDQVVPALTQAHAGAVSAQKLINNVQPEVTSVYSSSDADLTSRTGLSGTVTIPPAVTSEAATDPDIFNSDMTELQAQQYNAQQRAAAAAAMNAVAAPYTSTATTFMALANTGRDASDTPSPPATGFVLTPSSGGGSGSNGAANGYHAGFGSGGSSGTGGGSGGSEGSSGGTGLQSFTPPPPPPRGSLPTSPPTVAPPTSPPIVVPPTDPVGSVPPPPSGDPTGDPSGGTLPGSGNPLGGGPGDTDPVTKLPVNGDPGGPGGGSDPTPGVFGEGGLPGGAGGGSAAGGTGYVGEGGSLAGGTGSGIIPGRTSFGATTSGTDGVVGGTPATGNAVDASGQGAEQSPAAMMGGGMRGSGGVGGGGSESSGPSASYLRGRYLGTGEGSGSTSSTWETPAIGGSESVLIGAQPAEGAGVKSVYADARDSQGNPVGMMGGGFGGSRGFSEESEESGSRPGYLKEDPQWWTPEGSYVPPVVE